MVVINVISVILNLIENCGGKIFFCSAGDHQQMSAIKVRKANAVNSLCPDELTGTTRIHVLAMLQTHSSF